MNLPSIQKVVKRLMDVALAATLLVALTPVLLSASVLIRLKMGKPVLFRQRRPGLSGRLFTLYKFRTMNDSRNPDGSMRADSDRLTALGRWLRRLSLDELPQLWNVLRGDMSLVGPRPLLVEYLSRYTPEQARRHDVKPGITGWAQINGRNAISWERKFQLDTWYVDHWSLWLDLRILLATVWKVVSGRGVSSRSHATMPEFRGSV
jgi:sugar transferase EpsL